MWPRVLSAMILGTLGGPLFLRGRGFVRGFQVTRWRAIPTRLFSESEGGRGSAAVAQSEDGSADHNEALDLKPPRGTRDFYPEDMILQKWLFERMRQAAAAHNFVEYDAPVLENEQLYVRKAGEEVTQQLFNFEDKGGRRVSLRPEMTPTLARMVLGKRKALTLPLKWFSIPQCWRYERTTRGRRREHYQWNMDIWGEPGSAAEVELLSAIVYFFRSVGLGPEDVGIKINSRSCLNEILGKLGVPEDLHARAAVLIDKLDKVEVEAIQEDLEKIGISGNSVQLLLDTLGAKSIDDLRNTLGPESAAVAELELLLKKGDAAGLADWLILDASVVRGLAYYTSTVFEAFDRKGELRAICGGGRYNNLLKMFGAEPMPAVGFGFGDAVIVELLKERNLLPTAEDLMPNVDAYIFAFEEAQLDAAASIASSLRGLKTAQGVREGFTVEVALEPKKPKKAFRDAARLGAKSVIMIAPEEWASGLVRVKNMETGEQEDVSVDDLPGKLA